MKNKILEVSVPNYIIRIDTENNKCQYRLSDYKNKDNWKTPTDVDLIKSMAEYIDDIEESASHLENENKELNNMSSFLSVWRKVKDDFDSNTNIWIYDSHMGGLYHSFKELSYEDTYCDQCGDSDSYEWSGTIKDLQEIVQDYI